MKNKKVITLIITFLIILIILICLKLHFKPESYIITENENRISFNVPNTLKENKNSSNDSVRIFNKNNALTIKVWSYDYTVDEYIKEEAVKSKNSAENANLSKIETKTINNTTFFFRTLTYQSNSYKTYICAKLNNINDLFMIEIDGNEQLSDKELDTLLNISFE